MVPSLENVECLVKLIRGLYEQPAWEMRALLNPSDKWRRIYVELKRIISENVAAEVLGFGPFSFLPLTRQSPVAALELRTKTEGARTRKSPNKLKHAHLADIPFKYKPAIFEKTWARTEAARLEVLSGDDSAARARITFVIPEKDWAS